MVRDRLEEIRGHGGSSGGSRGRSSLDSHFLIEEISHPFISEFFEAVELVKNGCRNIEMAASTIDSINDATLGANEPESFDSLERVVLETNAKIAIIQKILQK